ncbi:MAG: bifunctional methylenetetrahydrofolate dehydrogenase/methenyltetrahydrofolate cyclohydrolase FolD [Caldicoprobacterales bacterium]|jgi:methylenetetrahydrofolate dehydrogenase (NADP+)/methenyltetrahydrofolate cyclohydrolase|nr:bifunctional methylenetetrahydrofolate dehydrogenase/methenyltetrahydrofolate cyclohydrolase FolD [Bacillota bacterium]
MSNIIDGKSIAEEIRTSIKERVSKMKEAMNINPSLTVILVGDNPASQVYVRNKERACIEVGIDSNIIRMSEKTSEQELLDTIQKLNEDRSVHGILVQLPLPEQINEDKIIAAIDPNKDVDGFHPINRGKLFAGEKSLEPCTPMGIIRLLDHIGYEIEGKNAVIIGRSNIVGKPVALMLLKRNATVTIVHTRTKDIKSITQTADILVVAVGRAKIVDSSYIKEGAVVIDVGINRLDGKLCGDVDFDDVKDKAGYITPVPRGVGPMTIAMLLENTLTAAEGIK